MKSDLKIIGIVFSVLVLVITIPAYGMLGAAVSTLIAYLLWALILLVSSYMLLGTLARELLPGDEQSVVQ